MAKIVFYDTTSIDEAQINKGLGETDHHWQYVHAPITDDNIDPEAEVVSIFVSSNLTAEKMSQMPKLRMIAARSTGFDNIDFEYTTKHDITVLNVPSYGENTVAEHAFSLLLAVTRKLVPTINETERGTFRSSEHVGMDLKGKTIGIIGMGRIGRHTAMIARGFQMEVVGYDPHPDEAFAATYGVEYVGFDEVLARSDIISLHTPSTPSNYHMINQHTIAQMKPGTIFVNTARGELVESRALIMALESGHLAGAALDTIEGEKYLDRNYTIHAIRDNNTAPINYERATENYVLLHMPNVVVTEHAAFNTQEAISRINSTTTQNIIDFWYGHMPNKVTAKESLGRLVIVRHSASAWNELGKWTGSRDVSVSEDGLRTAAAMGHALVGMDFDYAYTSQQARSKQTFDAIIQTNGQPDLKHEATAALNERDYGVYTGMEKHAVEAAIGAEAYAELRRSWDSPIQEGESLQQVYQRTIPFYLRIILPRLLHGQNILLVAHGNSIRALVKYIENISDEDISSVEMIQGKALSYEINSDGRAKSRDEISLENQA
jgi:D-lactate dehydrogenase